MEKNEKYELLAGVSAGYSVEFHGIEFQCSAEIDWDDADSSPITHIEYTKSDEKAKELQDRDPSFWMKLHTEVLQEFYSIVEKKIEFFEKLDFTNYNVSVDENQYSKTTHIYETLSL